MATEWFALCQGPEPLDREEPDPLLERGRGGGHPAGVRDMYGGHRVEDPVEFLGRKDSRPSGHAVTEVAHHGDGGVALVVRVEDGVPDACRQEVERPRSPEGVLALHASGERDGHVLGRPGPFHDQVPPVLQHHPLDPGTRSAVMTLEHLTSYDVLIDVAHGAVTSMACRSIVAASQMPVQ